MAGRGLGALERLINNHNLRKAGKSDKSNEEILADVRRRKQEQAQRIQQQQMMHRENLAKQIQEMLNALEINTSSELGQKVLKKDPNALDHLNKGYLNYKAAIDAGLPEEEAIRLAFPNRGDRNSADFYKDFYKFGPKGEPEEGDFLTGRKDFIENRSNFNPQQQAYLNAMLARSQKEYPKALNALGDLASQGFLDRLLFKGASEGFGNAIKSLGDVDPGYIGGALGGLASGNGIAGLLSGLVGNALRQYGSQQIGNQSPMELIKSLSGNVMSAPGMINNYLSRLF